MPSERFYNLEREKQERIISAAVDEFAREGYHEASINRIIKDADISRGSFYTYFVDKNDLFDCIFNRIKEIAAKAVVDDMDRNGGDIFETLRNMMGIGFSLSPESEDGTERMVCRVFCDHGIMDHIQEGTEREDLFGTDSEIYRFIQALYGKLGGWQKALDLDRFFVLCDMLVTLSIKSLVMAYKCPEMKETEKKKLFAEYLIIEAGLKGGMAS